MPNSPGSQNVICCPAGFLLFSPCQQIQSSTPNANLALGLPFAQLLQWQRISLLYETSNELASFSPLTNGLSAAISSSSRFGTPTVFPYRMPSPNTSLQNMTSVRICLQMIF